MLFGFVCVRVVLFCCGVDVYARVVASFHVGVCGVYCVGVLGVALCGLVSSLRWRLMFCHHRLCCVISFLSCMPNLINAQRFPSCTVIIPRKRYVFGE